MHIYIYIYQYFNYVVYTFSKILGSLFGKMCIKNARRTIITAATKDIQDINLSSFRTEINPVEHDESCLNKIYTVPSDITSLLMKDITIELKKQTTIFRELGILVRKPAIELISYLEQTDYTKSINKYVLCILSNLWY